MDFESPDNNGNDDLDEVAEKKYKDKVSQSDDVFDSSVGEYKRDESKAEMSADVSKEFPEEIKKKVKEIMLEMEGQIRDRKAIKQLFEEMPSEEQEEFMSNLSEEDQNRVKKIVGNT